MKNTKRVFAIIGLALIFLCFCLLVVALIIGNQRMITGMIFTVIFAPAFVWFLLVINKSAKFLIKSDAEKKNLIDGYVEKLKKK